MINKIMCVKSVSLEPILDIKIEDRLIGIKKKYLKQFEMNL